MLIDCDTCRAPTGACGDCVMTVLLDHRPPAVELDTAEHEAISCLAGAGLVPPLRLVVGVGSGVGPDVDLESDVDPELDVGPDPDHDHEAGEMGGFPPDHRDLSSRSQRFSRGIA